MSSWNRTFQKLLTRVSCDLPTDVEDALLGARDAEEVGGNARQALGSIIENVRLAREKQQPICQDTGSILVWVEAPVHASERQLKRGLCEAIRAVTDNGVLRRNCVDSLTGHNEADNVGLGNPAIHWEERPGDHVQVSLVLKGGGCENVGVQYALPDAGLGAERDFDGVRRCCLDAVHRAQGRGCAPGVLGVCIGGDRATGYAESKRQFLRRIGQRNSIQDLAELEETILEQANELGIGPMGFGGKTTLLDVFIGNLHRVPASYFVTVSYMCWAFRRIQAVTDSSGNLIHIKED
jgi:fumarate hydratase class I